MRIAFIVGSIAGLAFTLVAMLTESALSNVYVAKLITEAGWLLPLLLAFAILALSAVTLVGTSPKAWEDIFEAFYLDLGRTPPRVWGVRAVTTFLGRAGLSLFDLGGTIIEFGLSLFSKISERFRFHYEDRQIFIAALFAGALSAAFESPFFAALFAIELFASNNTIVRSSAIVASLVSYGVALLFRGNILSTTPQYSSLKNDLFQTLSAQIQPEASVGAALSLGFHAILTGVLVSLLIFIFVRIQLWASRTFERFFSSGNLLRVGLTGLLISIVYVSAFGGDVDLTRLSDSRIWEDLSWVRLSYASALLLLLFCFCRLALALSGWGSLGIFVPILTMGAVAGFLVGQILPSDNGGMLIFAGAAVAGTAFFGTPLAMSALLLESSLDVRVWWFGSLAIATSFLFLKHFRIPSFTQLKLASQNLEVYKGRVISLLRGVLVSELLTREVQTLPMNASVQNLREAVLQSPVNIIAVTANDGKYLGLLSLEHVPNSIRAILAGGPESKAAEALNSILEIRDLVDLSAPIAKPSDEVIVTLKKFSRHPCLAVVDEGGYLCGILFESAVHARYRKLLTKAFT